MWQHEHKGNTGDPGKRFLVLKTQKLGYITTVPLNLKQDNKHITGNEVRNLFIL
jgi:hypothetical protein